MDLDRACEILNSYAHLQGESNHKLIRHVKNMASFVDPIKALSPATGLDRGVVLRPVEALHQLAVATAPRYQGDLLKTYAFWGALRYLGFLDVASDDDDPQPPTLKVSDAGCRIVGNQRRVTSEEVGIAFGVFLARQWFAESGAGNGSIGIVDVDVAFDDGYVLVGAVPHAVQRVRNQRPDYILVAADPQESGHYRFRTLECKGTKYPSHAMNQLAKAVQQLEGITVEGRIPLALRLP